MPEAQEVKTSRNFALDTPGLGRTVLCKEDSVSFRYSNGLDILDKHFSGACPSGECHTLANGPREQDHAAHEGAHEAGDGRISLAMQDVRCDARL